MEACSRIVWLLLRAIIITSLVEFSLSLSQHQFHIINPKKSSFLLEERRSPSSSHKSNKAGFPNFESWPVLYKGNEKQMANLLWYEEGLYVDLPYGYIDNLTEFYDQSGVITYVQKVRFPPRLYYPISDTSSRAEKDAQFGQNVLSQVNDQMLAAESTISYSSGKLTRKRPTNAPKVEASSGGGAFKALQKVAYSILDQWLFSAKNTPINKRSNESNSTTEVAPNHPMRYLFLLGVLPSTFGSLYSLGYSPVQIMVIGAYIVTSYFMFVEKNPQSSKDDIFATIEETLSKVISSQDELDNLESQFLRKEDANTATAASKFKLSDLMDAKSAAFIRKFDSVIAQIFPDEFQ